MNPSPWMIFVLIASVLIGACAIKVAPPTRPASDAEFARAAWARVLARYVDKQGRDKLATHLVFA